MKLKVITVGKIKEGFYREAISHYTSALEKNVEIECIEVADEKAPESLSEKEMEQIKDKEGLRILEKVMSKDYVYALAIDGKTLKVGAVVNQVRQLSNQGYTQFVFIIGGSLGLSQAVLKRAQEQISFGKATFPHQLMKVVLLSHLSESF